MTDLPLCRCYICSVLTMCSICFIRSPILFHPPEQIRIVQHNTVFVHGKLGLEATAVEVLEEIEPVGQPCIGLRLWMYRQVRCEDPGHAELPPRADSYRLAAYREAVGERSWPN